MSVRVAFVTNIITPYRVTFYSKMAALPGINLLVVHGDAKGETGRPAAEHQDNWEFNHKEVENSEKRLGPFVIRWQAGVLPILRSFNPDVVVVLGISGTISNWMILIWGRMKRLRTLMWMCGWEAQKRESAAYHIKRRLLKFFIVLPTTLLVYSSKAKNYMVELGAPVKKCVICYNGLDIDESLRKEADIKEKAVKLRSKLNPRHVPVFLYVGGILPEKRVELLLKAFANLHKSQKAMLWIIGDGPAMPETKCLAASLDVRDVVFLGRIIDDVDPYFSAADFFVLPGIGGLALNQALFWGTPCICSEADGTEADLVFEEETGYRFLPNDEASLTLTLYQAVVATKNLEFYSNMTAKGRALIVTRSNTDAMLDTFHKEFIKAAPATDRVVNTSPDAKR